MSTLLAAPQGAEWLVVVVLAGVPVLIVIGIVLLVLRVVQRPRD